MSFRCLDCDYRRRIQCQRPILSPNFEVWHMWDMPLERSQKRGSGGTSAVSTHLTPQVSSLLLTKRWEHLVLSQSSALTSRTLPGLSLVWGVGSLPLTTWPWNNLSRWMICLRQEFFLSLLTRVLGKPSFVS